MNIQVTPISWVSFHTQKEKLVAEITKIVEGEAPTVDMWLNFIASKGNLLFLAKKEDYIVGFGAYTEVHTPFKKFSFADFGADNVETLSAIMDAMDAHAKSRGCKIQSAP